MLTWDDVWVGIKTVRGHREPEKASLGGKLLAEGIPFSMIVQPNLSDASRDTFLRLLGEGLRSGRPWIAHVEDDAALCPDFGRRALSVLADAGGLASIVSLYSDRAEDDASVAKGDPYRVMRARDFCGCVWVFLDRAVATALVEYTPHWGRSHKAHRDAIDYMIGDYCRQARRLLIVSTPSLVQHRDGKSLLGHDAFGKRRRSRTYLAAFGEVEPCP